MKSVRLLIGVVIVLGMANAAVSAVNAYDALAYETGTIVGETAPALGFTGAWGDGGNNGGIVTVEATSLTYEGADSAYQDASGLFQVHCPGWNGGRAGRFLDTDPNGTFAGYINANGNIGKPGQTIYMSYLMETSKAELFYAFELKRDSLGDDGAILYIGNDYDGSGELQVCAYRNKALDANLGVQFQWLGAMTPNTTELIVVRIDFGTTSDDVTVYRNPSLDAEPVMAPHLVGAGLLDFDGITMAAWNNGPRTAYFDEICIASTYADVVKFYNKADRAQNVAPLDGAVDLIGAPGVTLSWNAGTGVTPTGYKVYFSDVLDDVLTADAAAYQGTTTSTSLPIATIETDTTYYWSVTELAEPNDISGVVWMFETEKTYPVPVNQPVSQEVFVGENLSFTFDVTSETMESYQWFDDSGMLIDGGNISGTQTKTLTITGVQIANEGDYYCEVTNNAGMISSNTVNLFIKRLVGHWNLNQPAGSDPNVAWQDLSDSGNDLQVAPAYTMPTAFTWAEGADGTANGALVFDGQFVLGTKKLDGTMNDIPIGDEAFTISVWVKPDEFYNRGIIGWGNYGNNLQVNAVKFNHPSEIWHYWWNADFGANPGYSMADGNWHLVTITYDKDTSTRKAYIDGLIRNQDTPPNHEVQTSENFLLGKTGWPHELMAEIYDGVMDDVRVYNYALSAIEVGQMYTAMAGGDVCVVPPTYDLTNDCKVNLDDLARLAGEWLECGLVPTCVN